MRWFYVIYIAKRDNFVWMVVVVIRIFVCSFFQDSDTYITIKNIYIITSFLFIEMKFFAILLGLNFLYFSLSYYWCDNDNWIYFGYKNWMSWLSIKMEWFSFLFFQCSIEPVLDFFFVQKGSISFLNADKVMKSIWNTQITRNLNETTNLQSKIKKISIFNTSCNITISSWNA